MLRIVILPYVLAPRVLSRQNGSSGMQGNDAPHSDDRRARAGRDPPLPGGLGVHTWVRGAWLKLPRRKFLHLAAGAAALPVVSHIARAQAYPTRPVRIIVPLAPAGASDITARLIGQWLSERLGQPFIIDTRPGGGGNIGIEIGVRAPPDGYTLLMALSLNAINPAIYDNLPFNFIRDTAPVASIASTPLIMQVNPSVPAKTVPEFIAYAKANPGKINMASGGKGSPVHVAGELFKMMAGVDMVHVPYRGEMLAVPDLISGQVQVLFGAMPASLGYSRSRRSQHEKAPHRARSRGVCGVARRFRQIHRRRN
jgi:tripartite-type tricarboxylate transporter receptor subunit TctC